MVKTANKIKVACAMSGGVDSSVAAFLLKEAGFDVVGVFMKLWIDNLADGAGRKTNLRCMADSERRAKLTAAKLKIPFYALDVSDEFKRKVVDGFIAESRRGLTPNPCVVCNKTVKFGYLFKKAKALGASHIATGHYVKTKTNKQGDYELLKGKDKEKDQSYFLWQLTQKELARVIFPLGNFEKSEVRSLARELALPSRDTPESQEICFAPEGVKMFFGRRLAKKAGNIVDVSGRKIGHHNGLWLYTIGQRKGIGLSGGPYYVVKKDIAKKTLIVSTDKSDLLKNTVNLDRVNWIANERPKLPLAVKVRIRSRSREAAAVIREKKGLIIVDFSNPQPAVTPGQSAAIYLGSRLIGGGIIVG